MSTVAIWEQAGTSYGQVIFPDYVEHRVLDETLPWGYPTWFGVIDTQPEFDAFAPPPAGYVVVACCMVPAPGLPPSPAPVPEPSYTLLTASLVAMAMMRRVWRNA